MIFLDTGDIGLIEKYKKMGIIRGVTTNPTILLKSGIKGDADTLGKTFIKIAEMIKPYPLSLEITTNESAEKMIQEALYLSKLAENVNVKVPFHGPNGETHNLEVICELENKHNVRVNATAIMSAQQCLLGAMAGATYVSLFCGRINDMGYDSVEEVRKARKLIDDNHLNSQIICASTREVLNVTQWLNAGGHIVTVTPDLVQKMITHPYTKETVQMFLRDAEKAKAT